MFLRGCEPSQLFDRVGTGCDRAATPPRHDDRHRARVATPHAGVVTPTFMTYRLRALTAMVALAACGGSRGRPAAEPGQAPTADVPETWNDPEGDLPKGTARVRADRSAALANPKAKPIVIRNATVLT